MVNARVFQDTNTLLDMHCVQQRNGRDHGVSGGIEFSRPIVAQAVAA